MSLRSGPAGFRACLRWVDAWPTATQDSCPVLLLGRQEVQYPAMRLSLILPLAPALLLLAGCRDVQPYSQLDLRQVNQAYAEIRPIYYQFRTAFRYGDAQGIVTGFQREQAACKLVDIIDERDTIDPTTKLFTASSALDSYCNDIESAYAYWAKKHHLPYDKTVQRAGYPDVFKDGDYNMKRMASLLRHPSALS